MHDKTDGPNSAGGLSLYKIRRHLNASMKRLQTDHLEIYYMHHIDRNVTWDEIWDAFQPLVHQGRIDYVASSNFAGWHIAQAQAKPKPAISWDWFANSTATVCSAACRSWNCCRPAKLTVWVLLRGLPCSRDYSPATL